MQGKHSKDRSGSGSGAGARLTAEEGPTAGDGVREVGDYRAALKIDGVEGTLSDRAAAKALKAGGLKSARKQALQATGGDDDLEPETDTQNTSYTLLGIKWAAGMDFTPEAAFKFGKQALERKDWDVAARVFQAIVDCDYAHLIRSPSRATLKNADTCLRYIEAMGHLKPRPKKRSRQRASWTEEASEAPSAPEPEAGAARTVTVTRKEKTGTPKKIVRNSWDEGAPALLKKWTDAVSAARKTRSEAKPQPANRATPGSLDSSKPVPPARGSVQTKSGAGAVKGRPRAGKAQSGTAFKTGKSTRPSGKAETSPTPSSQARTGRVIPDSELPDIAVTFETSADPVIAAIGSGFRTGLQALDIAVQAYRHSFRVSYDQLICLPTLKNVQSLWYRKRPRARS